MVNSKNFGFLLVLLVVNCQSFSVRNQPQHRANKGIHYRPTCITSSACDTRLYSSTPQKPLYDGTNYTFPDTTSPDGIAEVLEVSFVHACMQLSSGYVDILKMFIAAALSSYQFGFPIETIEKALLECPANTANRPLMPEEVDLRHTWYSLVYLTLLAIDHPTVHKEAVSDSIPAKIRETYGVLVDRVAEIYKDDETTISLEELMKDDSITPSTRDLSEMERAVLLQSMRVATLTLVVLREAEEAGPAGQSPPKPSIKGAFD
jgi:hypothetical protein